MKNSFLNGQFARTALTFGQKNMDVLAGSRVIVFGIGGVGGYVVEALVRSGVGAIDIVDDDQVCLSNLNRQIIALHSTLGMDKVDAMERRILDINPECRVTKHKTFFLPENSHSFDFSQYDYIVDCIDTVKGKIEIIMKAREAKVPVISSMGAGNKVDPGQLKVADISRTSVCPLARVMRTELKKRGIRRLKCVFSTEKVIPPVSGSPSNVSPGSSSTVRPGSSSPVETPGKISGSPSTVEEAVKTRWFPDPETASQQTRQEKLKSNYVKQSPGSNAFVPSVAGLMIASEVVRDLTQFHVTNLFRD